MSHKTALPKTRFKVSRRDFVRGMALAATTAALPYTASARVEKAISASAQATAQTTQLPAAAEAQYQIILSRYGSRLSDEQKADVKRLVVQYQKISEALNSFPLDNSNEPAMIFHVYKPRRG